MVVLLQADMFIEENKYLIYMEDISLLSPFSGLPIIGVIIGPICGYVILFLSKGISESFTAVIDIANNTSK